MPKSFTVALIIKLRCIIRSRLPAATAVPAVVFKLTRGGCFSRAANAVPVW
ncbi:hypothetical protein D917_06434 [Trichinella nativa]|uniref:Uncharacterized protein n=1 Tax=Trichinella nativa TaxID=6335 RepID=A0A1Y3ESF3_9BILA|nr:hypothetical protein D917_06434 [Trichinella nativa]